MTLPAAPEVRTERLAFLDGARGLAAFAVVLSHVAAFTYVPWYPDPPTHLEFTLFHLGAPAVDFFFVLSGLVVARAVLRGGFSVPALALYVLRRVVRLLPVAWVGVLLGVTTRALATLYLPAGTDPLRPLTHGLGTTDWVGFATLVWPVPNANALNPPLWTLFVEMHMVLVMPLLAWIAARRDGAALAAFAAASVLVAVTVHDDAFLAPMFALGAFVGARPFERGEVFRGRPRWAAPALLAAGLAVLLVRHHVGGYGDDIRWFTALGAAAVIVALPGVPGAVRLLTSGPLQWLGKVSFSLYATHFPAMFAISWVLWQAGVPVTLAAFVAVPFTLPAAWLAWRAVEGPALRASQALARRPARGGSGAARSGN